VAFLAPTNGLIHDLTIKDDKRTAFIIESFGFFSGGTSEITIKHFKLVDEHGQDITDSDFVAGVVLKHTETESGFFIEEIEVSKCVSLVESQAISDTIPVRINKEATKQQTASFKFDKTHPAGFYTFVFLNCQPGSAVSFKLNLTNINPGPNYLSAGLSQLPTLYTMLLFVWTAFLVVWIFHFMRGPGKKVRIHHLVTVFIVIKILTLLFEAIEFHYKKTTGHPGGWMVLYYIFSGLKGTMMFVVIALIGTGWAFLKPFLSEKERNIFLVVIPLQILANIALVVLEETAPGSQGWFTWSQVLRLVDIICCGVILVPIIWSIKHLRDAAEIDGKAKRNMEKLQQFREFYLLVVTYIYFTRIIVFLLDAVLHYQYMWLGEFSTEMASLIFWGLTSYKFRPVEDNPLLKIHEDDDAEQHGQSKDISMEPLDSKNANVTIN